MVRSWREKKGVAPGFADTLVRLGKSLARGGHYATERLSVKPREMERAMERQRPRTAEELREYYAMRRAELAREVVKRFARGNVRLQLGAYTTAAEISKARERVLQLVIDD